MGRLLPLATGRKWPILLKKSAMVFSAEKYEPGETHTQRPLLAVDSNGRQQQKAIPGVTIRGPRFPVYAIQ